MLLTYFIALVMWRIQSRTNGSSSSPPPAANGAVAGSVLLQAFGLALGQANPEGFAWIV